MNFIYKIVLRMLRSTKGYNILNWWFRPDLFSYTHIHTSKMVKYSEQFKFRWENFWYVQIFMRGAFILCNITTMIYVYIELELVMLSSQSLIFLFELKRNIHFTRLCVIHPLELMHVQRTWRYDKMLFAYLIMKPTFWFIHSIIYDKEKKKIKPRKYYALHAQYLYIQNEFKTNVQSNDNDCWCNQNHKSSLSVHLLLFIWNSMIALPTHPPIKCIHLIWVPRIYTSFWNITL